MRKTSRPQESASLYRQLEYYEARRYLLIRAVVALGCATCIYTMHIVDSNLEHETCFAAEEDPFESLRVRGLLHSVETSLSHPECSLLHFLLSLNQLHLPWLSVDVTSAVTSPSSLPSSQTTLLLEDLAGVCESTPDLCLYFKGILLCEKLFREEQCSRRLHFRQCNCHHCRPIRM